MLAGSFKARDTVAVETPANLATSFSVDDWQVALFSSIILIMFPNG